MARDRGRLPFVQVSSRLKNSLAHGHPWVYRDAIERSSGEISSGQWVHVQCGNLQLYGLWDEDGAIAIRLFDTNKRPARAWVMERVRKAWSVREPLRDPAAEMSAYRWLFGESDGLPGVVVDLYGDIASGARWAVLRTYSEGVETLLPWVVDGLYEVTDLAGVLWRKASDLELLAGSTPPDRTVISEHGLHYEVDLLHGQKTGFYLDQRDNRRTVGEWSRGRNVLNLFAYTGGFSVCAVKGGAKSVTTVDGAAPAIAAAERNFILNDLATGDHAFVVADCFNLLQKYYEEGRRFDLIVVDPPSFARSREQLDAALHAYQRLNTLAMQCLHPDGLLASSSCTSQVSPAAFHRVLASAASDAKRRALILHEAGQPIDHPVPVHFPEARYLKFVLLAVETT